MLEKVLTIMKLDKLKEKICRPIFYHRIFCIPHAKGFYVMFSIKSLEFYEIDDIILEE